MFGHQRLGNHHDYSERDVTLLPETMDPLAVLQVGALPRDEPAASMPPDVPPNYPPPAAGSPTVALLPENYLPGLRRR